MKKLSVAFLALIVLGCQGNILERSCSEGKTENGKVSRIMTLERTVAFDTITVVIEGKVVNVNTNKEVSEASIVLNGQEVQTDKLGNFRYFHIAGGKQKLTVKAPCYQSIETDTINLGIGYGWNLVVGLACKNNEG